MLLDDILKNQHQLEKLLLRMPEEIKQRSSLKTILAGVTLTRKGEAAKYVYVLIKGNMKVTNEFSSGRRYTYARIMSIDFIGELEIMAGEMKYASNVEAVTNCRVLTITAKDFIKWIEYDPVILMAVSKMLAKKMYPTSNENGTALFFSGIRKLQAYIINYCRGKKDRELFLINRNRQQIADEIGTSVKTVNRCVGKLKTDGLLLIMRGKIYIDKEQYTNLLAQTESILDNNLGLTCLLTLNYWASKGVLCICHFYQDY